MGPPIICKAVCTSVLEGPMRSRGMFRGPKVVEGGALGVLWGHGGCLGHPMGPLGCFVESSDDSCGIFTCV